MNTKTDQTNPQWLLLIASLKVKQEMMRIVEPYGLNIVQAYTILLLSRNEAVPMHAISGLLSCDPSNVTSIVDRLEHDGYLERAEHPSDRRIKQVRMTDKGNKLRDSILASLAEKTVPLFAPLGKEDMADLTRTLEKILRPE